MSEPLQIQCAKHPRYRAERMKRKNSCETCHLLYILRWQRDPKGSWRVDGPNVYQFLNGFLDEICSGLRVRPR